MADKKRMSLRCRLGLHRYRHLTLTSLLMPIPLEECVRCGVGRQYDQFGSITTFTKEYMDGIRVELAGKVKGVAWVENER